MMQTSMARLIAHCAGVLVVCLTGLPMHGDAAELETIAVTATGGCKVWMRKPNGPEKMSASWTGRCDDQGFATGDGKLYQDGGYLGREAFIGEMKEGRIFTGTYFQNRGVPCLPPTSTSGQMTQAAVEAWARARAKGDDRCRRDNWIVQEIKYVNAKAVNYDESLWYFGTDAERIANQTGIAAFAANVRAQAPKKKVTSKPLGDACVKTSIVNGKKFCIE